MGKKGDKLTNTSTDAAEGIVRRLMPLGNVTSKRMFGGYGVFEDGTMFAIVDSGGRPFLKVNDSNRDQFERVGADRHGKMPYFSIPDEVLEQDRSLREWAAKSIAASKKA